MDLNFFKNQITELKVKNHLLKFFVTIIAISNIIFGFMAYKATKEKAIILVPVGYNNKITVDNQIDEMYLLEMSHFIFQNFLTYTPHSINKQYRLILTMFDNSVYPEYKKIFENFIRDAELTNLVSMFKLEKVKHDPKNHIVVGEGTKITLLNDEVIERQYVKYAFIYKYQYGNFTLLKFGKADNILTKEQLLEIQKYYNSTESKEK